MPIGSDLEGARGRVAGIGLFAGARNTTDIDNAIAIGAWSDVQQSNALVLGSTAAQNGQANTFVGIDVSAPSNILTVLQGGGNALADGWSTYSSRRWKTNIQTLPDALTKVEHLRGVSYDRKDSGKHEIGVIAEEVGAVVPELVSYEANGKDARGVDYSRLTALLIEATKQQQREIQQQRAVLRAQAGVANKQQREIQNLKSQLRETRLSLQKLKAQVVSTRSTLVAEK